jgi:hypothetical protein
VTELPRFTRGRDADVTDPTAFTGIEVTEHVDAPPHPARATVDRLVAKRVRQTLHRMA